MKESQKILEGILTSKNAADGIRENMKSLLKLIPEIAPMIGFEHRHPHHIFDVWEHTLCALSHAPNNFDVRLALLLHDIGKPFSFQEDGEIRHFKGHPEMSAAIARQILTRLDYPKEYVDYLCLIVAKHDTPLEETDIIKSPALARTIFEVQKCDTLAHNPKFNAKRLAYLDKTAKMLEENRCLPC